MQNKAAPAAVLLNPEVQLPPTGRGWQGDRRDQSYPHGPDDANVLAIKLRPFSVRDSRNPDLCGCLVRSISLRLLGRAVIPVVPRPQRMSTSRSAWLMLIPICRCSSGMLFVPDAMRNRASTAAALRYGGPPGYRKSWRPRLQGCRCWSQRGPPDNQPQAADNQQGQPDKLKQGPGGEHQGNQRWHPQRAQ